MLMRRILDEVNKAKDASFGKRAICISNLQIDIRDRLLRMQSIQKEIDDICSNKRMLESSLEKEMEYNTTRAINDYNGQVVIVKCTKSLHSNVKVLEVSKHRMESSRD